MKREVRNKREREREEVEGWYRMAGGAPAGIKMPPGAAGCRTTRTRMRTMTMQGKSKTAPRGTEMDELPFNRTRRRKKAHGEAIRSGGGERSSRDGKLGLEGSRLTSRCIRSIALRCAMSNFQCRLKIARRRVDSGASRGRTSGTRRRGGPQIHDSSTTIECEQRAGPSSFVAPGLLVDTTMARARAQVGLR